MNNEMLKKLEEISTDQAFADAFSKATSKEEAIKILADFGVDATEEDLHEIAVKAKAHEDGELSAEDLEDVAGGVNWKRVAWGVVQVIVGIFF